MELPKLSGRVRFEKPYGMKWRTVTGLERDGLVKPVRIGRKVFLDRDEIDQLIAEGGKRFAGGWRRRLVEE